jgi:hypothetical protein
MEPSRRNQWQAPANQPAVETGIKPNLLPWVAMVRRGSTVRVRHAAPRCGLIGEVDFHVLPRLLGDGTA